MNISWATSYASCLHVCLHAWMKAYRNMHEHILGNKLRLLSACVFACMNEGVSHMPTSILGDKLLLVVFWNGTYLRADCICFATNCMYFRLHVFFTPTAWHPVRKPFEWCIHGIRHQCILHTHTHTHTHCWSKRIPRCMQTCFKSSFFHSRAVQNGNMSTTRTFPRSIREARTEKQSRYLLSAAGQSP